MNITELARRLRISTQELRDKLPLLGFDIGQKAVKIDDRLSGRIVRSYREYLDREKQKAEYLKRTEKKEERASLPGQKLEIPSVLTVKDFASLLDAPVTQVIADLIRNGVMASMNQRIDYDTAAVLASDLGFEPVELSLEDKIDIDREKRIKEKLSTEEASEMQARPPIVVVMGHVDHGKTMLLDTIRKTNVVSGEAGGITQHIGAYQVVKKNRKITFIDTPGHEAFSAMRSRGAKVADIAILVVAANDGVKPQTVEALKIAQAAEIPIIVAINKVDLPDANVEKTKQEIAQYNLLPEEWGGNTVCVPISAKLNQNIDVLLENVLLVADLNEDKIKANPAGEFIGIIIESNVSAGEGPVATLLVKNGTLRVGDYVVMNDILYGKIRSMKDYKNKVLKTVGPSMPAKILGLKVAPKVGDILERTDDPKRVKKAKVYAMQHQDETFIRRNGENSDEKDPNVAKMSLILKTDVLGSQEAIIEALKKKENKFIKVDFVSKGLGNITESDVLSAEATGALILGFNVLLAPGAESLAKEKKVDLKIYKVIYALMEDVVAKMQLIVKPEIVREDLGKLEAKMLFRKEAGSEVVGGKVISGKVEPNSLVAVIRNGEFITSGKIKEIHVGQMVVTDVLHGQECGLMFIGQPIVEPGDILEVYKEKEIRKVV
jgi:translation initiation factor IF-2